VAVLALELGLIDSVDAKTSLKDQCEGEGVGKVVMALKEGSAPASCDDGEQRVGYGTEYWSSTKPETKYFVRACAMRDDYRSLGIVSSITTKPKKE
jgi:hypothetical protein